MPQDKPAVLNVELMAALVNTARFAMNDKEGFLAWTDSQYKTAGLPVPPASQNLLFIDHVLAAIDAGDYYLRSALSPLLPPGFFEQP